MYWGVAGLRTNYELQIRTLVEAAYRSLGEVPVMIGECGVPMDIKCAAVSLMIDTRILISDEPCCSKEEAFRTGDFSWHERMMDAMMCALERCLVGFT